MDLWYSVQVNLTENSGKPEEILVLDPAGTAPLVHLHRKPVSPILHKLCELKFRRSEGILIVPNKRAVAPDIEGGLHPLKADKHAPAPQAFRQVKEPHIAPH